MGENDVCKDSDSKLEHHKEKSVNFYVGPERDPYLLYCSCKGEIVKIRLRIPLYKWLSYNTKVIASLSRCHLLKWGLWEQE